MKVISEKDNLVIKTLTEDISSAFDRERIASLLFFGTRAFGLNINEYSDYDLMLILDKYMETDIVKLRKIIKKSMFLSLDINLNLLYLSDIKTRGKTNFQIRSLSLSFYEYLANAKLLLGENTFEKNPVKLTQDELRKIKDFEIQEYYGRCDKLYFQKITDKSLYFQLRKYTKDIIWFLLVRQGKIKNSDLTKIPYEKILEIAKSGGVLTALLVKDFTTLLKSDFNEANLKKLERIRRLVYLKYLSLYSGK